MFRHHDETSQPSSSSAATMTPSHGARDTSLISVAGLCGWDALRMSAIQTRPASASSMSSHCASAISRHHPVTLARGGSP